jgi:hypothetical protein
MDKDAGENANNEKQKDKKEICHSVLVLERLFRYMFDEDFEVTSKKTT